MPTHPNAPLAAMDAARYLLSLVDEETGESMTNLRLQKLLYYCQGFHLAIHGGPLFGEPMVCWFHGPAVPAVFSAFEQHGTRQLPLPNDMYFEIYGVEQKTLMDEVYEYYGQFSAWKLEQLAKDEPPLKKTGRGEVISHELLKSYFLTQLVHEEGQAE